MKKIIVFLIIILSNCTAIVHQDEQSWNEAFRVTSKFLRKNKPITYFGTANDLIELNKNKIALPFTVSPGFRIAGGSLVLKENIIKPGKNKNELFYSLPALFVFQGQNLNGDLDKLLNRSYCIFKDYINSMYLDYKYLLDESAIMNINKALSVNESDTSIDKKTREESGKIKLILNSLKLYQKMGLKTPLIFCSVIENNKETKLTLTIKSAKIHVNMDSGSAPDTYGYVIDSLNNSFSLPKIQDSYDPVWNAKFSIDLNDERPLTIKLIDRDAMADDLITILSISKKEIFEKFDKNKEFIIEDKRARIILKIN